MQSTEVALTESRTLREQFMSRTEVLDRVKALTLLADDFHATTEIVANYFEVDVETIKKLVQRNRPEVVTNGYRVLRGAEIQMTGVTTRAKALAVYTPRTVLNVALLTHLSPVAQAVRLELLNLATHTLPVMQPSRSVRMLDERHIYVIQFSSGIIKVGQTRNLDRRLADHEAGAKNHGHDVLRSWTSSAHSTWKAHEQALIDYCEALFGPPVRGREHFAGSDFDAVVNYASKYDRPMALTLDVA